MRLTGKHETASIDTFSFGVAETSQILGGLSLIASAAQNGAAARWELIDLGGLPIRTRRHCSSPVLFESQLSASTTHKVPIAESEQRLHN